MLSSTKWVCRQRGEYIKRIEGQISSLNDRRVAELEAIGFLWSAAPTLMTSASGDASHHVPLSRSSLWAVRMEQIKAFKAATGCCLVPKVYKTNQSLSRVSFHLTITTT